MPPLSKINRINKILYLTNLLLAVSIIVGFSIHSVQKEVIFSGKESTKAFSVKGGIPKPYSHYTKVITPGSLLFTPLIKEIPESAPPLPPTQEPVIILPPPPPPPSQEPPPARKIPLSERAANLSLIGIIEDKTGSQAVLRDNRQGKEYFLKKSDLLQGITIKEILQEMVILEYEDEQFELRM